ncbi:MAG TPA: 50S ribosomal protein L9 [Anaerolineae bacterium]|nr:50S ribosomal protein L9 [Anaerolineae bacterium]
MKVLLLKDVEGLGEAGDLREVARGYARNYLIPRGLAMVATPGAVKQAHQIKEAAQQRRERELFAARSLAEKIEEITLQFTARAGESGRLYGSITSADIALALEQATGEEIDKRNILLERPIRDLGVHDIPIKLHGEVTPTVRVEVVREGEEPAAEKEEPVAADG